MRVYLLPRRDGTYFLHAPDFAETAPPAPRPDASSATRLVAGARRAYSWLTRARRRREALLQSLGRVDGDRSERIRILYPSSCTGPRARAVYDALIRREIEEHGRWMKLSAAALPVSVPLSLIPGPNVLLGYLAYRSVVHYRSKKAGERAAALAIDFEPEPRLAELEDLVRDRAWPRAGARIRRLGEELGIDRLDELY